MSSYRSPDDPYQPTTFTKHPQANGSNGYAPVQTTSQKPANGNGKTDEFPFEDDVFLTDYEPIIAVMTEDDPDILETHAHDKPVDEEHPKNYGDFISFGWYTFFFMFAYELLMLPQVGNMTFMLYGAYTPQVVACGNTTFTDMPQRDVCKILPEIMNTTGCVPTIESQFGSLGAEFGWYCDTAKQVKKAVSVQMFGVFIGAPIMGQASDLFGRRRVVLWCLAFIFVLDMLAVRTVGLVDFTIVQTINMVFVGGMSTAMHVYLAESIHKKHRVWVMMLLSFSPNMVIFAVIAYFAQNWRTLMLISGIMTVPAFLALLLCYESPRWLIDKGRIAEARKVIHRIECLNGSLTEERTAGLEELLTSEAAKLKDGPKKKQKYYFYHLFYTAKMTKWILTFSYGLFCTAVISYAMAFNMEQFAGTIYINSAFLGLFRMFLNLSLGGLDYFVKGLGRKKLHQFAISYVVTMTAVVLFMKSTSYGNSTLITLATLSAAGFCSQMFVVIGVISSELFPTSIRNIAASFTSTVARFGGIVSPNLFVLEAYWIGLPYLVIVVCMSIYLVLFQLNIPETKSAVQSDAMPEKSEWGRKSKKGDKLLKSKTNGQNV